MIAFTWEGITSFRNAPLRLASSTGLLISGVSILPILWAFYEKFAGSKVPGWTPTVIPIFLSGD
jgi:polyisoprenyl-phosphate glycosyltransferase